MNKQKQQQQSTKQTNKNPKTQTEPTKIKTKPWTQTIISQAWFSSTLLLYSETVLMPFVLPFIWILYPLL